jgi:SPP1 family predicted phage head-tail adaptor
MIRIDHGKFKDRVQILARVATQEEEFGTDAIEWPVLDTVWAEVQDVLPSKSEKLAEGINIARQPARIRMRYRTDISSEQRLMVRGKVMQIVSGPAVLGDKKYIELIAESASTLGNAA